MKIGQDDYYTILGLPIPQNLQDSIITPEALKSAYRKALLQHHPDRKSEEEKANLFTVDQVIEAYDTLSNPGSRHRYYEILSQRRSKSGLAKGVERSAVETVDLEDLQYQDSPQGEIWEKPCRCGSTYQVSEKQLEEAASDGEIVVGCRGCSLAIKVVFGAVEE